jgi:hypothetical protein
MAGLSITGQMKVSTLQKGFLKEFGLTLRIYDGRGLADSTQTLSQVRKKKGGGKGLSVAKNMKVGNLEDKFEKEFGLKVQVSGSDGSYLCKDNLTLNAAQQADEKKLARKMRKEKREENSNVDRDNQVENKMVENLSEALSEGIETEPEKVTDKPIIDIKSQTDNSLSLFMQEIPLDRIMEIKYVNQVQGSPDELKAAYFDLLTGERVDGIDIKNTIKKNIDKVSSEHKFMKEVKLSDLDLINENVGQTETQTPYTFNEFNLKD